MMHDPCPGRIGNKNEDLVLLVESRKSTKKVPENWKKYRKCGRNRKMPFWSHGKLKKNLRKAGKTIFFLQKAGNRPPIPRPQKHYILKALGIK